MPSSKLPEPLAGVLRRHCNVNAFTESWPESLKRELDHPDHPERSLRFKVQLADAILHDTISPAQYESLTEEDLDTQNDLRRRLREIWTDLYGDPSAEGWWKQHKLP